MACVVCANGAARMLCRACRKRLAFIWLIDDVACVCPRCGAFPLELAGFAMMYPKQAGKRNPKQRVLITHSDTGCHRCAPDITKVRATIWQVKK